MYLFLITTFLSLITFNAGEFAKPLYRWIYRTSTLERVLLTKKAELKLEQGSISMVDEFAKYSKLQRKINTVEQELADLQSKRLRNNLIVRMLCVYVVRFILGLILMFIAIYYRTTPLLAISKRFDFFPLKTIISYPSGVANAVSVPFWIMCCTTVGSLVKISW